MSNMAERLNAALEGRYAIERELGEGGMATVYLADDLKHERKVALKVLKPELAAVVGAERFLAETANVLSTGAAPVRRASGWSREPRALGEHRSLPMEIGSFMPPWRAAYSKCRCQEGRRLCWSERGA
jgi:hypothetical protein